MDWKNILISVLLSLIPAVFIAFITVRLSLRQFYSQKWWEKKAEVYSDIIGHLTDLNYSIDEVSLAEKTEKGITKNHVDKLVNVFRESLIPIKKAAISGAYAISDKAALELRQLIKKLEDFAYFPLVFDQKAEMDLFRNCLERIRKEAKKDLKIS